ncbi:MAG: hypothetical protein ACPGGE_03585 [Poseidonia sp.]
MSNVHGIQPSPNPRDDAQDARLDRLEDAISSLTVEVRSIVSAVKHVGDLMKWLAGVIVAAIGGTAVL